jgi:hypothetical protein
MPPCFVTTNKKATYNCPVAEPRRRGEACVNGFQVLSATTTGLMLQLAHQDAKQKP